MQFIGSHHLIGSLPGAEEQGAGTQDKREQRASWQHPEAQEPLFASLILLSLAMLCLTFAISVAG
ncbi:hypothetical protein [Shewanella sp. KCT]|uniref:hypothetical protein n=1 Tax=Shewanella sp. KCT TaxID=2569535 RepID=UPI0011846904|nr:hypothetical protein [Shewanella sp. KCT]TVP15195.1 hypothetical protein AYI87_05840 [Shewanella sp. KCT]